MPELIGRLQDVLNQFIPLSGPRLTQMITSQLIRLASREKADMVLREMGRAMGGYVRGVVILAFIGLSLIGVYNPLLLGVITMLGEFVSIIAPIADRVAPATGQAPPRPGSLHCARAGGLARSQKETANDRLHDPANRDGEAGHEGDEVLQVDGPPSTLPILQPPVGEA